MMWTCFTGPGTQLGSTVYGLSQSQGLGWGATSGTAFLGFSLAGRKMGTGEPLSDGLVFAFVFVFVVKGNEISQAFLDFVYDSPLWNHHFRLDPIKLVLSNFMHDFSSLKILISTSSSPSPSLWHFPPGLGSSLLEGSAFLSCYKGNRGRTPGESPLASLPRCPGGNAEWKNP